MKDLQMKIHLAVKEASNSEDIPKTSMLYAEPGESKKVIQQRVGNYIDELIDKLKR